MKGNKKILVAIVLMLLISVTFTTLAIYRSSATATGTIKAAAWSVKVGTTSMESAELTFGYDDITWTKITGKNDTIAPGSEGTIKYTVDATGSEVDVLLTAELGDVTGLPNGMTATMDAESATLTYGGTMSKEFTITIKWEGTVGDSTTKDGTDKAAQGSTLTIPVTLTARQKLTTD